MTALLKALWMLVKEIGVPLTKELLDNTRLADDPKTAARKAIALVAMQRSYRP